MSTELNKLESYRAALLKWKKAVDENNPFICDLKEPDMANYGIGGTGTVFLAKKIRNEVVKMQNLNENKNPTISGPKT